MNAPALTPAEQATIDRFGLHDEEILRDIAEHANDTIPCVIDGKPATHRIIMRCCNATGLMCTKHAAKHRRVWTREARRNGVICGACGHDWPPSDYDDIIRVVTL